MFSYFWITCKSYNSSLVAGFNFIFDHCKNSRRFSIQSHCKFKNYSNSGLINPTLNKTHVVSLDLCLEG